MTNPRTANGHRRRELRARVLAAYDTCALCGHPVDKTLRTPHPMSAEVDEIIPVSLGGDPLSWENCRLSHRLCNQRRGNGRPRGTAATAAANTALDQPLPQSRTW